MTDKRGKFLENYHYAVTKSNQGSLDRLKARVGLEWANMMRERYEERAGREEFSCRMEEFLRDELGLCDEVKAEEENDQFSMEIKGCRLCQGNERLRKENLRPFCPVTSMGLSSISRIRGRKATLKEVEKNGPVGECTIKYEMR